MKNKTHFGCSMCGNRVAKIKFDKNGKIHIRNNTTYYPMEEIVLDCHGIKNAYYNTTFDLGGSILGYIKCLIK